jgi:hypothetical protein
MAVLSVDKVFQFVQFVANKESRGWVSPAEFNIAAELAQIAVYSRLESHFLQNKKIHNDMRPFLKESDETIATGVCPFPTGFRQLIQCRIAATDLEINELVQGEIAPALNSLVAPPTSDYPACVVRDDGIHIYPINTTGDVAVEFIAGLTTTPTWAYTLTSNRPVFDDSSDVPFEFHDNLFLEIATLVLANVGMNINDQNVTQYGMAFNQGK